MLSSEEKEKLEKEIVELVVQGLESRALTEFDSRQIAEFVLKRVNSVENHQDMLVFLKELTYHWPLFSVLLALEKGEIDKEKEQHRLREVSSLLKENKVEEALTAVKEIQN